MEETQQMFFVPFPKECLFRNAGHSVLLVEMKCPLPIIKKFSTLDNNSATESVLEERRQTGVGS